MTFARTSVLAAALAAWGGIVPAQEAAGPRSLQIELNAAADMEGACRLSFMVENRLGADLTSAVFETVLFDAEGTVDRLTLFDMRELPEGRPRVRQFRIDGMDCAGIGRILFNGAQSCEGEGLDAGACMGNLGLDTRTDIEVLG